MTKIAVYASGNGSNFQAIAEHFKNDEDGRIKLLVCNVKEAYVVQRAKQMNIPVHIIEYIKDDRVNAEKKMIEIMKNYQIDVIVLAGFMKIFTPYFINNITVPIINIHPSLLPKYKGTHAIKKAFDAGDQEIGITIHYVNEEVDNGEIILQKRIPLKKEWSLEVTEENVHQLEHRWYPEAIKEICKKSNSRLKSRQ
jgi:phosphoribosylglycinamide formyltransferase 1